MKRVLIVYNPRSSQYAEVERAVLEPARNLAGYMVGKYEVKPTDVDKNAADLAKIVREGDLVIAAGGDATAVIAANGILRSGAEARLAVLPYGNFNDLARTLGVKNFAEIFGREAKVSKLYPLEIMVDGKFFRYATCYVTIGMTAEAVEIFDEPKVRRKLKSKFGRKVGSYLSLMKWYFKNRRREFLPEFRVNGVQQRRKTSDYAAVNGASMARVMKGGDDWRKPKSFRSKTERTVKFWPLSRLMMRSVLVRVPGEETQGDVLEFAEPANLEIQAEGEYRKFAGVKKIEIRKNGKFLRAVEYVGADNVSAELDKKA